MSMNPARIESMNPFTEIVLFDLFGTTEPTLDQKRTLLGTPLAEDVKVIERGYSSRSEVVFIAKSDLRQIVKYTSLTFSQECGGVRGKATRWMEENGKRTDLGILKAVHQRRGIDFRKLAVRALKAEPIA